MGSASGYGVPGILALALTRYESRRAELAKLGVPESEIDARIVDEAHAEGGALAPGERMNLSFWSERFGIARAPLEAIVLAIHRRETSLSPPPPPMIMTRAIASPEDDEPISSPPRATRFPDVAPVSGIR